MTPAEFRDQLKQIPNLPCRQTPSKRFLVLIPVFKGHGEAKSYASSALYTLYSFLTNTDALHEGVDVKLYVDESVKEQVFPVLEANGVDPEANTMLYKWGFNHIGLSQKLYPFLDDRLLDAEVVFIFDADVYVMRSETGEPLNLFEKILGVEEKSALSVVSNDLPAWKHTIIELIALIGRRTYPKNAEIVISKLLQTPVRFREILGKSLKPITYFFSFLPKTLRKKYAEFTPWFTEWGHIINTDEEVLRIASLLGKIDYDTNLTAKHQIQAGGASCLSKVKNAFLLHGELTLEKDINDFYRRLLG